MLKENCFLSYFGQQPTDRLNGIVGCCTLFLKTAV